MIKTVAICDMCQHEFPTNNGGYAVDVVDEDQGALIRFDIGTLQAPWASMENIKHVCGVGCLLKLIAARPELEPTPDHKE